MVFYKQSNQGGAIVSFIIIAICLAIGVIGTVYFVQQRGEQARRDEAIALADKITQQTANNPADTVVEVSDDTATEPVTVPADTTDTNPVATTPAPTELPATGPASDIIGILMFGTLVGMMTAYMSSRRTLLRSL
jgi:Flp pilus assembly protein TadG